MIEKIKKVNNPLTIIAIFAGLAEIAGTVVLGIIDKSIQHIFVWFVMVFPIYLVTLFFVTLNFNAKALYAPSDYKNEENFIKVLEKNTVIENNFDRLLKEIEYLKHKVESNSSESKESVLDLIKEIEKKVVETKDSTMDLSLLNDLLGENEREKALLMFIAKNKKVDLNYIAHELGVSNTYTYNILKRMLKKNVIKAVHEGKKIFYIVNNEYMC